MWTIHDVRSAFLSLQTTQADRYYSCYYCKTHSNQQEILEKHIEETHKTLTFKYEVVKESVTKLECLYCSKVRRRMWKGRRGELCLGPECEWNSGTVRT